MVKKFRVMNIVFHEILEDPSAVITLWQKAGLSLNCVALVLWKFVSAHTVLLL